MTDATDGGSQIPATSHKIVNTSIDAEAGSLLVYFDDAAIGSLEQAAEAANVRNYAGDVGALDVRAHQLNALVTGSDVYTGCRIGGGVRFFHVDHSFPFQQ